MLAPNYSGSDRGQTAETRRSIEGVLSYNEAFQRKLDHQMSLHANVPKVFCAVVSNVAQAIGKARDSERSRTESSSYIF